MWTYRQTWADGSSNQITVKKGNLVAGYIARREFGPQKGNWSWSGAWVAEGNNGIAESREAALEAIRQGFDDLEKTDRDRLECFAERPYSVLTSFNFDSDEIGI